MSTLQATTAEDTRSAPIFELHPGGKIGKRYQIEKSLGSGGMATIYLAYDTRLERQVALKILRPEMAKVPELVERFLNEARCLAKLNNTHVARILDFGRIQESSAVDIPFIVMEFLDGVDLLTRLQQNYRLGEGLVARYVVEACEGLAQAHALGIVHRDIKPENLFLARTEDGSEIVKVLDFGISKPPDQSGVRRISQTGFAGSPHFMSPEQTLSIPVDARTDIWGLGAVMFECVTGRPPFDGSTVYEVSASVLNGPLPDLRGLDLGLSEPFIQIIEGCLKRNPAERFQNVAQLARSLEPLAATSFDPASERIARILDDQCFESKLEPKEGATEKEYVDASESKPHAIPGLKSYREFWVTMVLLFIASSAYVGYRYSEKTAWFVSEARHFASHVLERVKH